MVRQIENQPPDFIRAELPVDQVSDLLHSVDCLSNGVVLVRVFFPLYLEGGTPEQEAGPPLGLLRGYLLRQE